MTDNAMKGRRLLGSGRAPKTVIDERQCAKDGCRTLLSKYNRKEFCYSHAPTKFPRLRGRIVAEG